MASEKSGKLQLPSKFVVKCVTSMSLLLGWDGFKISLAIMFPNWISVILQSSPISTKIATSAFSRVRVKLEISSREGDVTSYPRKTQGPAMGLFAPTILPVWPNKEDKVCLHQSQCLPCAAVSPCPLPHSGWLDIIKAKEDNTPQNVGKTPKKNVGQKKC